MWKNSSFAQYSLETAVDSAKIHLGQEKKTARRPRWERCGKCVRVSVENRTIDGKSTGGLWTSSLRFPPSEREKLSTTTCFVSRETPKGRKNWFFPSVLKVIHKDSTGFPWLFHRSCEKAKTKKHCRARTFLQSTVSTAPTDTTACTLMFCQVMSVLSVARVRETIDRVRSAAPMSHLLYDYDL